MVVALAGIGVSSRNLWDMKRFYEHYKDASPKLRRSVAVLPCKHNLLILSKTNSLKEAEYVGKMNCYFGLLDRLEKRPEENVSIGIILCADKDHLDVEIALQDINKPIGIAEYQLLLPA